MQHSTTLALETAFPHTHFLLPSDPTIFIPTEVSADSNCARTGSEQAILMALSTDQLLSGPDTHTLVFRACCVRSVLTSLVRTWRVRCESVVPDRAVQYSLQADEADEARAGAVDKKFLDPRRPIGKPTPEDQEEGLRCVEMCCHVVISSRSLREASELSPNCAHTLELYAFFFMGLLRGGRCPITRTCR
eukprot:1927169-Rhodomonas_salina.1